jgi:hypothetical protein
MLTNEDDLGIKKMSGLMLLSRVDDIKPLVCSILFLLVSLQYYLVLQEHAGDRIVFCSIHRLFQIKN